METVTRWIDRKNDNLEIVENLLLQQHPDSCSESAMSYINWKIEKKFDSDQEFQFNGKIVKYNFFRFSVDQIPGGSSESDDAVTKNGFLIPYLSGGKIQYIISRNSNAMTLLRKMLLYTGKNEISNNSVLFSADLFVWLINRVYNCENKLLSESDDLSDLTIHTIIGFKGNTEDLLTKISTSGETVMNILSTLSFLIESQNLNQITLDVAYRNNSNIAISLSNRNIVGFDESRYTGELVQKSEEELYSKIMILLYSEILPIINLNYQNDIDSNRWGQGKCVEFLSKVAADLSEKVETRINELRNKPEQLKMQFYDTPLAFTNS